MSRSASVQLRRTVDDAVGRHYDAVFTRLDRLVEGRCDCRDCHDRLLERCAEMVAALPAVRDVPEVPDQR